MLLENIMVEGSNKKDLQEQTIAKLYSVLSMYLIDPEVMHMVELYNYSGDQNPYHNNYHMLSVAANAHYILQHDPIAHDIPIERKRNLIVAALWHDFDHSGGKLDDDANIKIACTAFKKYVSELSKDRVNFDIDSVIEIIECTRFPFTVTPDTPEKKIIRDADLLQSFGPLWFEHTTLGILDELNSTATEKMDLKTFLEKQIEFLESVELFTKTAKNVREKIFFGNNKKVMEMIINHINN